MVKLPKSHPLYPPEAERADYHAFKALAEGKADEDQQKRVLEYLDMLCGTDDLEFREQSDRHTNIASGKRFVGLQIRKLIQLDLRLIDKMKD